MRNVVQATLTPLLPKRRAARGVGIVVCPGGAFHLLSTWHEGFDVAKWLVARGVAAFVLKYRVVPTPSAEDDALELMRQLTRGTPSEREERWREVDAVTPLAVADGARALQLVREHATKWNVQPDQVGILGFSAGGTVALGTVTAPDPESRPNFVAALYLSLGRPQVWPPADLPPLFLAVANDDPFFEESLRVHQAWRGAQSPVEFHAYQLGGHGFGINDRGLPIDDWPNRFLEWLDWLRPRNDQQG